MIYELMYQMSGTPEGIRTPNNGSEDHRDIHFTTGAAHLLLM